MGKMHIRLYPARPDLKKNQIWCSPSFCAAWNAGADYTTRKVSVCPPVALSVCLSNAWIVTKRKKDLSRFLYHTKDHLA